MVRTYEDGIGDSMREVRAGIDSWSYHSVYMTFQKPQDDYCTLERHIQNGSSRNVGDDYMDGLFASIVYSPWEYCI